MLSASVPFRATLSLLAPSLKALTAAARSFSFSAFAFVASAIFLASLPAFLGSRLSLYEASSVLASSATPVLSDAFDSKSVNAFFALSTAAFGAAIAASAAVAAVLAASIFAIFSFAFSVFVFAVSKAAIRSASLSVLFSSFPSF